MRVFAHHSPLIAPCWGPVKGRRKGDLRFLCQRSRTSERLTSLMYMGYCVSKYAVWRPGVLAGSMRLLLARLMQWVRLLRVSRTLEQEIDMSKTILGITTSPLPSWVPSGSTVNQIRTRERNVAAQRQSAAETLKLWAVDAHGQPDDDRRVTIGDLQPSRFDE